MLEFRKEEGFDKPCAETRRAWFIGRPTYLVDLQQFYDADLHLALKPAYAGDC